MYIMLLLGLLVGAVLGMIAGGYYADRMHRLKAASHVASQVPQKKDLKP